MIILSGSTNFAYFDNQIYKKFNYIFFLRLYIQNLKLKFILKIFFHEVFLLKICYYVKIKSIT